MAPTKKTDPQDLDEDLFRFDDLSNDRAVDDEDADLDEIFATFNDREFDPPPSVDDELEVPPAPVAPPRAAEPVASRPRLVPPLATGGETLAPPPAAPAAPPVAASANGVTRLKLSPSVLLLLASITTMNGLVALIAMKSSTEVRTTIERVGDDLGSLTHETIDLARDAEATLRQSRDPFGVNIDPSDHPTLAQVEEDMRLGDFAGARQRLYALLSILDRLDPAKRAEVERRATFLLGTARHLEALARVEAER